MAQRGSPATRLRCSGVVSMSMSPTGVASPSGLSFDAPGGRAARLWKPLGGTAAFQPTVVTMFNRPLRRAIVGVPVEIAPNRGGGRHLPRRRRSVRATRADADGYAGTMPDRNGDRSDPAHKMSADMLVPGTGDGPA